MPVSLDHKIDWSILASASQFYPTKGYKLVEVPWVAPSYVVEATKPADAIPLTTQEGDLIGSGEQGLLWSYLQGHLQEGTYLTITPCFRSDPRDDLHGRHFMKAELMHIRPDITLQRLQWLLKDATEFFSHFLPVERLRITDEQIDLVCAKTGIELGSYGIRSACGVQWVYGTGVAEPRLSQVLRRTISV